MTTVSQLITLAKNVVARTAPEGLKRNSILRHLGQLQASLGTYGDIEVNTMSPEGRKALARAEREGKLWARKDCGCK
jgi:hypothetical protein